MRTDNLKSTTYNIFSTLWEPKFCLVLFLFTATTESYAATTGQQDNEPDDNVTRSDDPEREVIRRRMTVVCGSRVCAEVAMGSVDPHVSYKSKTKNLVCAWMILNFWSNHTELLLYFILNLFESNRNKETKWMT